MHICIMLLYYFIQCKFAIFVLQFVTVTVTKYLHITLYIIVMYAPLGNQLIVEVASIHQ